MRLNGLFIVYEKAVRAIDHPRVGEYPRAVHLGSIARGRVVFAVAAKAKKRRKRAGFRAFFVQPLLLAALAGRSRSVLTVGPKMKANAYFRRAVEEYARGQRARAFVSLGRIAHLIADMSCPVHAQRVVHETDPFEWWVDAHKDELMALPLPAHAALESSELTHPADLIEGMSRFTQSYRADRTNHLLGRVLKTLGRRKSLSAAEAGAQARVLVPMAALYTESLLRLFLRQIGELGAVAA